MKTYTIAERAKVLYQTVVDVFDYSSTSDIVTPTGVIESQLNSLPSIKGKILVPGAGIGSYVNALIQRGVEPSDIYAVEISPVTFRLGSRMFSRLGVNYIHADFLTWGPHMQFDVIIGNPPYQDADTKSHDKKLWTKFFDRSLELLIEGGILSFVTPNSLVGRTRLPAKRRAQLSTTCSLESIDHTTNSFFPQVGVDVCSWVVKKIPYGGATQVIDSDGARVVDLCEELPVPMATKIVDDLVEKIRDGIGPHGVPELKRQYNDVDQTPIEEGEYVNYYSGRHKSFRTNDTCKNTGQLKVVFSFSATYKQWFVTDQNVSGTNVYVPVTSVEEGLEIGESLMHPIITYYIDNWRRTAGFCPAIKNNGALPDVRGFSTEDLIDKFELTDEEYEYIQNNHQPYKSLPRVL